jgi:hypothetical protein
MSTRFRREQNREERQQKAKFSMKENSHQSQLMQQIGKIKINEGGG